MLEREKRYFEWNRQSLLAEYPDKVVVIMGEGVVGVYDDKWTAFETETRDNHRPIGSFLVRRVTEEDESTVIISSLPRVRA